MLCISVLTHSPLREPARPTLRSAKCGGHRVTDGGYASSSTSLGYQRGPCRICRTAGGTTLDEAPRGADGGSNERVE